MHKGVQDLCKCFVNSACYTRSCSKVRSTGSAFERKVLLMLEEFLEFILYGLPTWISTITTLICCLKDKDNDKKEFEPSDNVVD